MMSFSSHGGHDVAVLIGAPEPSQTSLAQGQSRCTAPLAPAGCLDAWRAPEVPGSNARQSSSVEQPRARHPGTHCRLPDDDAAMQAGHPTHVASHSPLPGSQGCSLHAEPPAAPIVRACVRAHGRENNAGRLCDATLNLEMARRRFSYLPFPPGRRQNQTTYQVGKQGTYCIRKPTKKDLRPSGFVTCKPSTEIASGRDPCRRALSDRLLPFPPLLALCCETSRTHDGSQSRTASHRSACAATAARARRRNPPLP